MPVDNKRISSPVSSYPIATFSIGKDGIFDQGAEHKRLGGRRSEEVRPFFLRVGLLSQAKGSAYVEMERTKVVCAVYGPREIAKRNDFSINGQIYCEFKYAPFACKLRRQHQQDNEEKELSQLLKEAIEPAVCLYKFPKAQVDVFATVLDNDGGALSGAITAAGAALANAGIPMYDLLVGCNLHYYDHHLLVDPTSAEETKLQSAKSTKSSGNITLGLMPSLQQVTCLFQAGTIEKKMLVQAIKTLTDICHQLQPVLQKILISNWKSETKEKRLEED